MREQSLGEKLRSIGWTVTESGCWEWKGTRNDAGYGVFRARAFGIDRAPAHRVMYEHHVGPVPDGLMVRHKCDNPPCVNPEHLLPGTAADNHRDKVERGRARYRTRDPEKIAKARVLASEGKTRAQMAAVLGVSERSLSRWLDSLPMGRPRVSDEQASARTLRRRKPPRDPESVSLAEAGRALGVTRERARQLAGEGKLERHPSGGVTRSSVEAERSARASS